MVLQILMVACIVGGAFSYPTGAPKQACDKLAPIHMDTKPQASQSPYSIMVSTKEWMESGVLSVAICGDYIGGFILQARQKSDDTGFGMFDDSNLPNGAKLGPCMLDKDKISVTHTSPDNKTNLVFRWKAPEATDYDGAIYFQGAVAQSHDVYWTDLKSLDIDMGNSTSGNSSIPAEVVCPKITTTKSIKTPTTPTPTTTTGAAQSLMSASSILLCAIGAFIMLFGRQ